MKIFGRFNDKNTEWYDTSHYEVIIEGNPDDRTYINIDNDNDIFFDEENPVQIEWKRDIMNENIIVKSCRITLLTRKYLGDLLFSNNNHDIKVNVVYIKDFGTFFNQHIMFAGYVEPNVYSQGYANDLEKIEIECIDGLGALSYHSLLDNVQSDTTSFRDYLNQMGLNGTNLDLWNNKNPVLTSVKYPNIDIKNNDGKSVDLLDVGVPSTIFAGDTPDSNMKNDEILSELLKYFNLNIVQNGFGYILFNNDQKNSDKIIYNSSYCSDSTSISIDEAYNQFAIECDLKNVENILESPFEEDSITSKYDSKQLYATEVFSNDVKNTGAYKMICDSYYHWNPMIANLVLRQDDWYDPQKHKFFAWYLRLIENNKWTFNGPQGEYDKDIYNNQNLIHEDTEGGYIYQNFPLIYAKANRFTPLFVSFSCSDNYVELAKDGKQPQNTKLENYIVFSVNGDGTDIESTKTQSSICYNNKQSVTLTPTDSETINYILISGKLLLQGIVNTSNSNYLQDYTPKDGLRKIDPIVEDISLSKSTTETIEGNAHYVITQYNLEKPNSDLYGENVRMQNPKSQIIPPSKFGGLNKKKNDFIYQYNSENNSKIDNVSKVPVLECQLKVGDKYLVEYYDGYEWRYDWFPENNLPYVDYEGERIQKNTFSIGFNPQIGDNLIGKEFEIENTVTESMNLGESKGLAIPIRFQDTVSGPIDFKILGPINTVWKGVVRRHPTWFRSVKYTQYEKQMLPFVENIYMKDFKCEIITDNGGIDVLDDKDLVYEIKPKSYSYLNKADSIKFKVNTALTSKQAKEYGIRNKVNYSSAIDTKTKRYISTINGKLPEINYLEEYYNTYSKPKLVVDTELHYSFASYYLYEINDIFNFELSSLKDKKFYMIGMRWNAKYSKGRFKFREV